MYCKHANYFVILLPFISFNSRDVNYFGDQNKSPLKTCTYLCKLIQYILDMISCNSNDFELFPRDNYKPVLLETSDICNQNISIPYYSLADIYFQYSLSCTPRDNCKLIILLISVTKSSVGCWFS